MSVRDVAHYLDIDPSAVSRDLKNHIPHQTTSAGPIFYKCDVERVRIYRQVYGERWRQMTSGVRLALEGDSALDRCLPDVSSRTVAATPHGLFNAMRSFLVPIGRRGIVRVRNREARIGGFVTIGSRIRRYPGRFQLQVSLEWDAPKGWRGMRRYVFAPDCLEQRWNEQIRLLFLPARVV